MLRELLDLNEDAVSSAPKLVQSLLCRGAYVGYWAIEDGVLNIDIEYDFPEHVPTLKEIRANGKGLIKSVTYEKQDACSVSFAIEFKSPLTEFDELAIGKIAASTK